MYTQSHKQSLGRKLQEREADMKTKQEQVSLAEQVCLAVVGVLWWGLCHGGLSNVCK